MGQIVNKFKFQNIEEKIRLKDIQILTLDGLDFLFQKHNLTNIIIGFESGIGERGKFENQTNNLLEINFKVDFYSFDFYLFYDQLEYYITKSSKVLGKCNLEDYTEKEEEMVFVFLKYLKKDLKKLDIPFNE